MDYKKVIKKVKPTKIQNTKGKNADLITAGNSSDRKKEKD